MQRHLYIFALIAILLSATFGASTTCAHPRTIRNIGATDGLSDLLVNSIFEDADGLIWFGTGSTLEQFDGLTLTHYPLPQDADQQSLRIEAITGIDKQIFCCNNHTLYCIDKQTNELHSILSGQIEGIIRDLCVAGHNLYIATSQGLYIYNTHTGVLTRNLLNHTSPTASQNELRHLKTDANGNIWVTSKAGLHNLSSDGNWSHYYYSELPDGGFTELAIIEDYIILGSFHNGIYMFHTTTAEFALAFSMVSPIVTLQAVDSLLMVATDGDGVFLFDRYKQVQAHYTSATQPTSLTSNSIYRALVDSRRILWVGYYQHGLDYTLGQTQQFSIYQSNLLNTQGMAVRSLTIHGHQGVIGTRQGLYWLDSDRQLVRHYDERVLNSKMVFATLYHNGLYYIGTYGGGLYTISDKGEQPKRLSSPFIGRDIFSLALDSIGRVWVGSDIGVAALNDGQVVRHFAADSTSILPAGYAYCIYFDRANRGWFCTESGVVLYDAIGDSLTTAPLPADFPTSMTVRNIYHDRLGRMYFIPQKGETYVTDSLLRPCSVPLPKETNFSMIEDSLGQLWITTADGLYCRRADNSLHRYSYANGLPSAIFTLCLPQRSESGTIWLGNSEGLIALDPANVAQYEYNSRVSITRIEQHRSTVTFRFSDLRYSDPGSMYYEYRLEGMDENSHIIRSRGEATYTDLRPGNYTFRVQVYGEPDTETTVSVHVPLSLRDWLQIILVALLVLALYPAYRLIRHYLRTNNPASEDEQSVEGEPAEEKAKYANVSIPAETLDALNAQIDAIMEEQQLYLRQDLKIAEVAKLVNVPPYQLSYLFTQHMQTTFYDYLYDFRIEEFKRRIIAGELKRYTVEALAERCGFNSRASFFRIFKKKTGTTPNEYIKQLKNEKSTN